MAAKTGEAEAKAANRVDSGTPMDLGSRSGQTRERAEIDTSVPFDSVKEAASRFGGMAFWKPTTHQLPTPPCDEFKHDDEMMSIKKVEEEAALLERDLIVKERETFKVLKELESTKNVVEELRKKLQKKAPDINYSVVSKSDYTRIKSAVEEPAKEHNEQNMKVPQNGSSSLDPCPSSAPGSILLELNRAKLFLTRTTSDLAGLRATVESYNEKIAEERTSGDEVRRSLSSNISRVSFLEEELSETRHKLQFMKDTKSRCGSLNSLDITPELQRLTSETEQFKKLGKDAKSEVSRTMLEIEQTKMRIKTAHVEMAAAEKMKEAAKASEAASLAEIRARSSAKDSYAAFGKMFGNVILTFKEYSFLASRAQEAEQACNERVAEAMLRVDEANHSRMKILTKVKEATEEVKISKKALEETLHRMEAASQGKLLVEKALCKWRSEHGERRSSVHNSTKFKNSCASNIRKEPCLLDVNGVHLVNDEVKPVLKASLSIGQILSRKMILTEEYENKTQKNTGKRKVSLGQMLSKSNVDTDYDMKAGKENVHDKLPSKRKKFRFARIPLIVAKKSLKKQQQKDNFGYCLG